MFFHGFQRKIAYLSILWVCELWQNRHWGIKYHPCQLSAISIYFFSSIWPCQHTNRYGDRYMAHFFGTYWQSSPRYAYDFLIFIYLFKISGATCIHRLMLNLAKYWRYQPTIPGVVRSLFRESDALSEIPGSDIPVSLPFRESEAPIYISTNSTVTLWFRQFGLDIASAGIADSRNSGPRIADLNQCWPLVMTSLNAML